MLGIYGYDRSIEKDVIEIQHCLKVSYSLTSFFIVQRAILVNNLEPLEHDTLHTKAQLLKGRATLINLTEKLM